MFVCHLAPLIQSEMPIFLHSVSRPLIISVNDNTEIVVELSFLFVLISCSGHQSGKPRNRQLKVAKHTVDSGGVINISDDSSSDSDGMDTDSNSSPDSLLDNDDVIFVNHTSCQTGRKTFCLFSPV